MITGGKLFFFFNDTATTEIYTLSLHDALPICPFLVAAAPRFFCPILVAAAPPLLSCPFFVAAVQIGRAHV